jgi:hypothetical protein
VHKDFDYAHGTSSHHWTNDETGLSPLVIVVKLVLTFWYPIQVSTTYSGLLSSSLSYVKQPLWRSLLTTSSWSWNLRPMCSVSSDAQSATVSSSPLTRLLKLLGLIPSFPGDLHGNYKDLMYFAANFWRTGVDICPGNLLFLGDYVDRGPHSVELMAYLLALKVSGTACLQSFWETHEGFDPGTLPQEGVSAPGQPRARVRLWQRRLLRNDCVLQPSPIRPLLRLTTMALGASAISSMSF